MTIADVQILISASYWCGIMTGGGVVVACLGFYYFCVRVRGGKK